MKFLMIKKAIKGNNRIHKAKWNSMWFSNKTRYKGRRNI